jgi:hypothetical protein
MTHAVDLARQIDRHADRLRELARVLTSDPFHADDSSLRSELVHWNGVLELVMGACPEPGAILFVREGEYWTIGRRRRFRLRDSKGLAYLARLLVDPGREFHALDLVCGTRSSDAAGRPAAATDASRQLRVDGATLMAPLDQTAREAYRARIEDLQEAIARASANGDAALDASAREELGWLEREIAAAYGLGRRERPGPTPAERARQSVTKAIRVAIDRIEAEDADLARHLGRAVRTGTFCS